MNEKLISLLGAHADRYPHKLEASFPHVIDRMVALWGSAELRPFLDALMLADRPGRQGFPPEVATEIFRLVNVLDELDEKPASEKAGWDLALDNEFTRPKDR
ncbi:MAG: hypothetical protein WCF44_00710 [Candidatus Methylophosphatis roskildensis]